MISYDSDKIYSDNQIGETGIYYSVGFSASHVMHIIQALLDKFNIERSEFVYSARSTKSTAEAFEESAEYHLVLFGCRFNFQI